MRRARIFLHRDPKLLLGLYSIDSVYEYIRLVDSHVDDVIIIKHFDQLGFLYMLVGNLEQKLFIHDFERAKGRSVLTKRVE